LKKFSKNRSGDTIVEVILSFAIFSLVCMGTYGVINMSLSSTRESLNISVVRNLVDSQATSLRFIQNAYIATYSPGSDSDNEPASQWKLLTDYIKTRNPGGDIIDFGAQTNTNCPDIPNNSFIMNPKKSSFIPYSDSSMKKSSGVADLVFDGSDNMTSYGVWIEADRSSTSPAFIDFYIRACWIGSGSNPSIIGTIVRLYDTE